MSKHLPLIPTSSKSLGASKIRHAMFLLALMVVTIPASQAQTYKVLYNAAGGPGLENMLGAIAQGHDGNLYSTSLNGGTFYGTIFKSTPTGVVKVINDIGYFPASGVTLGTDGQFYGTNQDGGVGNNCGNAAGGQVYKVTAGGKATVLHGFTNTGDGCDPQSAPIEGTNGIFYGTTNSTAYSVTSTGVFTTLHTFTGPDGTDPIAPLVQGADGNLYGTTYTGGANGNGVIYKMTPAGAVTVLHSFLNAPEGSAANYALIQASDGNFYGVANAGGTFYGTVFKMTPSGTYTVLHTFAAGPSDGAGPSASLVQATDGKLYGVTSGGGTSNVGTIFSITTSGTYSLLYNFATPTGAGPSSPLLQHTNGKFYGETINGGNNNFCNSAGCGVIYSFDMGFGGFARLMTTSGADLSKVEILGEGFSKTASVVKFGGVAATTIVVSGSTYITATVPAGAQSGFVTVTTGSTTLTSTRKFTVLPSVISFTPTSGPVGTAVTITGNALTGTTGVTFNGVAVGSFTVVSDTEVTTDVPSGAKTGKVAVTTPTGTAVSKTNFTVK